MVSYNTFSLKYVIEGLKCIGHTDVDITSSGSMIATNYRGDDYVILPLYRGGQIPPELISSFKNNCNEMNRKGMIISPTYLDDKAIRESTEKGIELLTYDYFIDNIDEKIKHMIEVKNGLIKEREEAHGKPYVKAELYFEHIKRVDESKTNDEKKKSLEKLMLFMVQDLGLSDPQLNLRGPSSEIDITAKNDKQVGYWRDFSHYILFECKNWNQKVGAKEIRDFREKASKNTRFFVAWNGISGQDELHDAKLEIIKAYAKGIQILVLTRDDLLKIASGTNPEKIIGDKYYALQHDKVL